MSYRQTVTPNGIFRLTDIIPFTADCTIMVWYRGVGARANSGSFPTVFYIGDDPQTLYVDYVWAGMQGTNVANASIDAAGTSIEWTGGYPEAKRLVYNHWCYQREGTTHRLIINGDLVAEGTKDVSAFPHPTHFYVGTDSYDADWEAHDAAHLREWDAVLTLDEIVKERNSARVVRTLNLWAEYELQQNFNPSVILGPATAELVLDTFAPDAGRLYLPSGELSLAGAAPTVPKFITVPTGALGFTGRQPDRVIA